MSKLYFKILTTMILLLTFIPLSAQLADSPWPMFRHDPQHTGRSTYSGPESPQLNWKYKTLNTSFSDIAVGNDGIIYFGSANDYFYAINPDGTEKWKFRPEYAVSSTPAIGLDGTIYINTGTNLLALKPDGDEKWKTQIKTISEKSSSPAIGTDGTIYLGLSGEDGNLYAINPDGSQKWKFLDEGWYGSSSPAIGKDGTVYYSAIDAKFYHSTLLAINPDGTQKWKKSFWSIVNSKAIASDGTIYFATGDVIYAINPDGNIKWEYKIYSGIYPYLAIGNDDSLYFRTYTIEYGEDPLDSTYNNFLNALNPDGTEKWILDMEQCDRYFGNEISVGADGTIYPGSCNSYLYAIGEDGSVKWKFKTGGNLISSPVINSEGYIYFLADDGNLYSFGEEQSPESIEFGLNIEPDRITFSEGDTLMLTLDLQTPTRENTADIYFIMLDPSLMVYFALDWDIIAKPVIENIVLPADYSISSAPLIEITIPSLKPQVSDLGTYTFAIAATEPGTTEIISNIAMVSFNLIEYISLN